MSGPASELIRAAIMRKRIDQAIRGKIRRTGRAGHSITLAALTQWALARYPDDLDDAYARRLVRQIARRVCG